MLTLYAFLFSMLPLASSILLTMQNKLNTFLSRCKKHSFYQHQAASSWPQQLMVEIKETAVLVVFLELTKNKLKLDRHRRSLLAKDSKTIYNVTIFNAVMNWTENCPDLSDLLAKKFVSLIIVKLSPTGPWLTRVNGCKSGMEVRL